MKVYSFGEYSICKYKDHDEFIRSKYYCQHDKYSLNLLFIFELAKGKIIIALLQAIMEGYPAKTIVQVSIYSPDK